MEYVNLGSSGVKVSRICLGCMTYGSRKWREWVLDEQESRPLIRQAIEAGINFFDTADMYSVGVSEEILGARSGSLGRRATGWSWAPRSSTRWAMTRTCADSRASTSTTPLTTASGGSSWTTWIFTRSIGLIRPRRWKKPWKPCTMWCAPARRSTSALPRCGRGNLPRCFTWPGSAAGRASSRCRTTTTCFTGRKSER